MKKGHAQRGSAAPDEAMLKARGQAEQYARALPERGYLRALQLSNDVARRASIKYYFPESIQEDAIFALGSGDSSALPRQIP